MTKEEFIAKFCPDIDSKIIELERLRDEFILSKLGSENEHKLKERMNRFRELMFEESLQNFTDKICEIQRINCAESATIDYVDPCNHLYGDKGINLKSIFDAEQPKIEDL